LGDGQSFSLDNIWKMFVLVLALGGVVDYYITKSPKYLDDGKQENPMNNTLSSKLGAFMLALGINTIIMGGVALIFSEHAHDVHSLTVAANVVQQFDRSAA